MGVGMGRISLWVGDSVERKKGVCERVQHMAEQLSLFPLYLSLSPDPSGSVFRGQPRVLGQTGAMFTDPLYHILITPPCTLTISLQELIHPESVLLTILYFFLSSFLTASRKQEDKNGLWGTGQEMKESFIFRPERISDGERIAIFSYFIRFSIFILLFFVNKPFFFLFNCKRIWNSLK